MPPVTFTFIPSSLRVAIPSPAATQKHSALKTDVTGRPRRVSSRSNSVGIFSMSTTPSGLSPARSPAPRGHAADRAGSGALATGVSSRSPSTQFAMSTSPSVWRSVTMSASAHRQQSRPAGASARCPQWPTLLPEVRMPLATTDRRALDEDGYLVLPGFLSTDLLAHLRQCVERLFAEEGEAAGSEFKQEPGCRRLANLVDKGDVFRAVIAHPQILESVRHVLGPDIKLSSLNARSVNPDGAAQPLHPHMPPPPPTPGPP